MPDLAQRQAKQADSADLARRGEAPLATVGHPVLRLQRMIGNRAVSGMIRSLAQDDDGLPASVGPIQAKLTVNEPGDEDEREADRIANQVMLMPEPRTGPACDCGGEGCPRCRDEGGGHEHVQTKRASSGGTGRAEAPPGVHEVLRSPGEPLDAAARGFFEPRFARDFGGVRVHADSRAARVAQSLDARAFTVGGAVVFGAGQYAPHTFEGRTLIAHELAHVLQQGRAVRRKIQFDPPTYFRESPIDRSLGNKPVGLTTPTANGKPLPDNLKTAGQLVFEALTPKNVRTDLKTKECYYTDFESRFSANVIVPTAASGGGWTANLPPSRIADIGKLPGCASRKTIPVVMVGKPTGDAVVKKIEQNEQEHVDDLKALYAKYLKAYFDWLLSLKQKGDDQTPCDKKLEAALGNKDAVAARDYLLNVDAAIKKRHAGNRHKLDNKIKTKTDCAGIDIESTAR